MLQSGRVRVRCQPAKACAAFMDVLGLQGGVTVRDCQVGANFMVQEGSEHRDEVLARPPHRVSNDAAPASRA